VSIDKNAISIQDRNEIATWNCGHRGLLSTQLCGLAVCLTITGLAYAHVDNHKVRAFGRSYALLVWAN
jgi:hypothetical protein